jgi:hypothetical protein
LSDEFRCISGIVQFPPADAEVTGKKIRNITVRQTGVHDKEALRVQATLWPSHDGVKVEEGDVVVMEGKYNTRNGQTRDGEARVFHNLSVTRISVNGSKSVSGTKPATENTSAGPLADDEDLPF